MTWVDEDELQALRARAYGPGADIHQDPEALERLKQLEFAVRPPPPPVVEETPLEVAPEVPVEPEPEPEEEPAEPISTKAKRWAGVVIGWLRGLRRSTVLIALGVAAFIAVIAVVLALVQRVQVDPLQSGAEQVARLQADGGYEIPRIFSFGTGEDGRARAFQAFLGLRALVTPGEVYADGTTGECLSVFSDTVLTDLEADSFNGPFFGGCSAGGFPAMTQFSAQQQSLPDDLLAEYPDASGFQFVYDSANNEVVVFAMP